MIGWVATAVAAIFVLCKSRRKSAVHGVVTEPSDDEITVTVVPPGEKPKPAGIDAGAIPGDPVYQS